MFRLHLTEKQGNRIKRIHGCWVWILVNTKLKFNYNKNLDVKKIVNYSKVKWKATTVLIYQQKTITCNITKNENTIYCIY